MYKKPIMMCLSLAIVAALFTGCHIFGDDTNILTYYTPTPTPEPKSDEADENAQGPEEIIRLSVDVPVNSLNALLDENIPQGCSQVILVTVTDDGEYLYCAELMANGWKMVYGPFDCNIGRNGMGKQKEGDGKSPAGVYELGRAFGQGGAPNGSTWPWRETTEHDYWVEDSDSKYYNQYININEVEKDWGKAENLLIQKYRFALEVKYNPENTPGIGSAIFLHVWGSETETTGGCTAMEESSMETILKWLRPEANPLFFQNEYIYQLPEGFCYIRDYTPEIVFDIRFAGDNNLLGHKALEYYSPIGIASDEMAKCLDRASILLKEQGLKLMVYDSYRPQTTVNEIVDWLNDENDNEMKSILYPNTSKSEMTNMYFSELSPYSRGAAVDVSIVDKYGHELDMGTQYQFIDEKSAFGYMGLSDIQINNREILRDVMIQSGLTPNEAYWWSFYLEDEPFPNEYFDFYVQ